MKEELRQCSECDTLHYLDGCPNCPDDKNARPNPPPTEEPEKYVIALNVDDNYIIHIQTTDKHLMGYAYNVHGERAVLYIGTSYNGPFKDKLYRNKVKFHSNQRDIIEE